MIEIKQLQKRDPYFHNNRGVLNLEGK